MAPKRNAISYSRTVKKPRSGLFAPITLKGDLELKNVDTTAKWCQDDLVAPNPLVPTNNLVPTPSGTYNGFYICEEPAHFNSIVNISRGHAPGQRTGMHVVIKGIETRFTYNLRNATTDPDEHNMIIRCITYVDKQFNNGTEQSSDPGSFQAMFKGTDSGINATKLYNPRTSQRFIILDDYTVELMQKGIPGPLNNMAIKSEYRKIKCNIPINYSQNNAASSPTGGSGDSAEIATNNISIMLLISGGGEVTVTGNTRVTFIG